jgi:hypothetical protein
MNQENTKEEKPWYAIQASKIGTLSWQIEQAEAAKESIETQIKAGEDVRFQLTVGNSFGSAVDVNLGKITKRQAMPILTAIENRVEEMNQELEKMMLNAASAKFEASLQPKKEKAAKPGKTAKSEAIQEPATSENQTSNE